MVEKDPFIPRRDKRRVRTILITFIVAIAGVTTMVMMLNRQSPKLDLRLSHVKPGRVITEVGLTKWYIITRLSARWVKKEQRDGELSDVYEVTGQVRKKYQEVPDVATIIVKPYVGLINVSTKSHVLRDVMVGEAKPFTVEVVDPTQARDRGEDVKIVVSAHPNE
ncbi:MAG: hypothetical protein NZT92_11545 [Abditibacteriales bacterium]|nr:hypothetical protein [Abditibacteriales bacterium]MDW8367000.1 hypothetical protein [Abditibacteriales bacterium]